jgi:hypothetical protein
VHPGGVSNVPTLCCVSCVGTMRSWRCVCCIINVQLTRTPPSATSMLRLEASGASLAHRDSYLAHFSVQPVAADSACTARAIMGSPRCADGHWHGLAAQRGNASDVRHEFAAAAGAAAAALRAAVAVPGPGAERAAQQLLAVDRVVEAAPAIL